MTDITKSKSWRRLETLSAELSRSRTIDLFAADPKRAEAMSIEAAGLYLDYSKNKVSGAALSALLDLAREADLAGAISRMVSGEKINSTEGRAVLHVALRDFSGRPYLVDGENVAPLVAAERGKMKAFAGRYERG